MHASHLMTTSRHAACHSMHTQPAYKLVNVNGGVIIAMRKTIT
jgi:hypothetical protein